MPIPRFGTLLADLLKERGWTQEGLAERSGVNQAVISQIVTGKRSPPLKKLPALVAAFDLPSKQAELMLLAGEIEHTPPRVVDYVRRLEARRAPRRAE